MRKNDDITCLKVGAGFMGIMTMLMLLLAVSAVIISPPAAAGGWYNKLPRLSDALQAEGFETLKFALDTTGLTQVLDSNRVTLFAPTNDVFEATAEALGCDDALDLATRLLNIPVGDSNELAVVLTHHAALGVIKPVTSCLMPVPFKLLARMK